MRLSNLLPPRPSRPKFMRRRSRAGSDCSDDGNNVDLEAQISAPATPAPVSDIPHPSEKVDSASVHFRASAQHDGDRAPPAYESIVASTRLSISGGEQGEAVGEQGRPSICVERPGGDQGASPTIMVLFKEDYDWARAYLRDLDYRVALRRALRRHLYKWYALIIIIITISALVSAKHTTIVEFCQPVTKRIRAWPGGWLIPIALLIIVSFPPLVGHEIIGILCGLVWGIGEGFGILAAGTFFGELATWVAFKWLCTARARKYEQRNRLYAALTQLIREKSFTFVLVLRFSAVPGHITTAVSASAGANIWSYCAAAILTLPKQLVIVYLGTSFGSHSTKNTIISWSATIATFIGTIIAAVYIYYHMRMVIRRGDVNPLPTVADPRTSSDWADLKVHGARGVGAGLRVEVEDAAHARQSVDVVFGPHARLAQQQQMRSPLRQTQGNRPRALTRTRSLPGPITEVEMRAWLTQMDTALMTSAGVPGAPQIRVVSPQPVENGITDDDLDNAGPSTSRAATGDLDPIPYATLLLSPPALAAVSRPESPQPMALPDLAHEHVYAGSSSSERPMSTTVPAILLTPTYTPARSRADSLRGTVSLDIERPRQFMSGREIAEDADEYAVAHGARRPDLGRMRGESSAALLGRPHLVDRSEGRRRGESSAASLGRPVISDNKDIE